MKLTIFLLLISVVSVLAGKSYSQTKTLNLSMSNASVKEILSTIEEQSEFYFMYSEKIIDVNREISVDIAKQKIEPALGLIFAGTDVEYTIKDKIIVLTTPSVLNAENKEEFQQRNVTGTVTDKSGQPLSGVTVSVKNTNKGAITNSDGKYTISIGSSDATLVFSFIGMNTQEIIIGTKNEIDVVLQESIIGIEDVVVTALGIKSEKKALGYATAQVDADQIGAVKAANNFVEALNGKVAGVQISSPSSQPGSGTRIVMRGGSSISGNNQPLLVVNGIPFDAANGGSSSGFADIDPNSIENLSILKGAAASALYGSSAANGVILVTLKSGSYNKKQVVTVSHTSSFESIYEIPLQNTWSQGTWNNTSKNWVYADGETVQPNTSWGPRIADVPGAQAYDRWSVFNTGYTRENNFSITGGNTQASYFVSYSNLNNQGVLDPLTFKRNTINVNSSFKLAKKLTVSTNMMYSKQRGTQQLENAGNSAFMNTLIASPPTWNPYPMYDVNGKLRLYRGGGRNPYLFVMDNAGTEFQRDRFTGAATIEYEILPYLKFRSVTGLSITSANSLEHFNKGGLQIPAGYYNNYESFSGDIESNQILTFDKTYGDFSINAMVGNNIVQNTWRGSSFSGTGLIIPGVYNASNVSGYTASATREGKYRSYSFYGEARIGYKSMLYYTLTGRNDHPSSLSKGYFYPSNSIGFIFSELISNKKILSFGKLRASYAKVGAPAGAYATNSVLSTPDGLGVKWPFNGQMSYLESSAYPNPLLTNEFKNETEIGTELKFFQNRLGIDMAYYHNWSTNQIVWEQLLPSTGYSGGNINIGGITHKGLEISLYGTPVKKENFSWDVIVNWSKDNSVVDKLGQNDTPIFVGSSGTAVVGESYPVIYGTGFLRDDQGRLVLNDTPGSSLGSPQVDNSGNKVLGKISPDWIGSLRNTFTYKGLSLMMQFDVQKGGFMFSQNDFYLTWYGMAKHQETRPEDNMITFDGVMGHYDANTKKVVVTSETPVPTTYSLYWQNAAQQITEAHIMPKDYIKLRELQVTYQIPEQFARKLNLKGLSIGFSGRNLWRKYKDGFEGSDTETNTDGINNGNAYLSYSFPSVKTYSFTLNVNL